MIDSEIDLLFQWREYRSKFLVRNPLSNFNTLLDSIAPEARYSDRFKSQILNFIDKFALHFDHQRIEGIFDYPETIPFSNMVFVLTSKFQICQKKDIAANITERGGIVNDTVTLSTHYLIVGNEGSQNYSFGTFGSKIKKTLKMRDSYISIVITEEDYF